MPKSKSLAVFQNVFAALFFIVVLPLLIPLAIWQAIKGFFNAVTLDDVTTWKEFFEEFKDTFVNK